NLTELTDLVCREIGDDKALRIMPAVMEYSTGPRAGPPRAFRRVPRSDRRSATPRCTAGRAATTATC
ncbi:hypothetical protein ACWC5I_24625, partial [Kitasatospora sp. NPDC001574]